MKLTLKLSILAITLLSAGATAMAHERYPEDGWSYRNRGYENSRYNAPDVVCDRYGNRVYVTRSQRYAPPVEEHCYRAPVVVPECRRPQARFELPLPGPLRFIFGR
ncbi:MAG: hypothetical protein ABIP20_14940 [Chthoniobacteraceae bacterium]